MVTISNPPIVQEIIEEAKAVIESDSPITKRKNNNLGTPTAVTPSPSVKKSRPRRFVWTLNKVIILFGLFSTITFGLTVYMFKQIS